MEFKRWNVRTTDLVDMTPIKARDLIVKCFFEAQKETFLRSRKDLGLDTSDEDLYASVVGAVRMAFNEIAGDFDNPSKEQLFQVVEVLARKAKAWGTPEDIVEHHKGQIKKIFGAF